MKSLPVFALLSIVGALALASVAAASTAGTDNTTASAYSGGWTDGTNGAVTGAPFNPWSLSTYGTSNGNSFAGFQFDDSTKLQGNNTGANIDTGGTAFKMYGTGSAGADAYRNFAGGALTGAQSFSLDLAVNYRNGYKGFDLKDASNNTILTFNVGGDDYTVSQAATGNGSIGNTYGGNTAFHLTFTQIDATAGTWSITRSGDVAANLNGTYTGDAAGFHLYIGGTDGSDQDLLFANNFQVAVPEPATWMAGLLTVGLVGYRFRRTRQRQA